MKPGHLLIAVVFLWSCSDPNEKKDFSSEQRELTEQYSSTFPNQTQLSIAVINGRDVAFAGFIKQNDKLVDIDNRDSVFQIASISKVFTSTILTQLAVDSVVDLNAPLESALPFRLRGSNDTYRRLTFESLSNHTSGFPRMPSNYLQRISNNEGTYDGYELEKYLRDELKLKHPPGDAYSYSNLGYATLGYVVERMAQVTYEDLLQGIVCRKYGLTSTTSEPGKVSKLIVTGRDSLGHAISYQDMSVFKPAGGILSSIVDLSKFVMANFTDDQVLRIQQQETYHWGNTGMALGWQLFNYGGQDCAWYHHDGALDGYRSALFMDIEEGKAVIILSNVSVYHPNNSNIIKLATELLKKAYLKSSSDCAVSFLELASKRGWGTARRDSLAQKSFQANSLVGVWSKNSPGGRITRTFFPDNKVQSDFDKDDAIDVWGYYDIEDNRIIFSDIGGLACLSDGAYTYSLSGDTLRFKEIDDKCEGRRTGLGWRLGPDQLLKSRERILSIGIVEGIHLIQTQVFTSCSLHFSTICGKPNKKGVV